MTARLSLAQQIAQLDATAPADFDIEDGPRDAENAEEEITVDGAAAREHYLDVGPSAIRKLHDSVADPKYNASRVSRKQLLENSEPEEDLDEDEEEDQEATYRRQEPGMGFGAPTSSDAEEEGSEEEVASGEGSDEEADEDDAPAPSSLAKRAADEVGDNRGRAEEDTPQDLSTTLKKTRDDDRKKGKAVSRQIAIWDTLLDSRIRLQKSVTAANRLPAPLNLPQYAKSITGQASLHKMLEEALSLSEELFELQSTLITLNEPVDLPPRKKRKLTNDDETPDYAAQLEQASQSAASLEHAFHPHLVQTLSKWSSKIQAVAPSVLLPSTRNAFSSKNQNLKSAVQLIDETLVDHTKVLARTRVRRGKGQRVGADFATTNADEGDGDDGQEKLDTEVFDDADFYQQLLRDVIDSRGNGAAGADDWMSIQKQKKAKNKVDTKASKGRKLRYEVHEKLQNFMVPVPAASGWHEEQIDELFSSLLGKGFESFGSSEMDAESAQKLDDDLGEAIRGGFRVFG